MSDVKIRVITEKQGDDLKTVDRDFASFAKTLAGVAGGAAIIGATMKKAFDLGKEGAALRRMDEQFHTLAASIGTTSEALEGDLREATRGMIRESELLASASGLMSLGLAQTHDEAVRLTRVAAGLNMDMNQLTLTLTNKTTMRFDALGVKVAGFNERLKEMKDRGMDVDAAFKEAFLQQAEEQLALVGDVADSDEAAFIRLENSIANLVDTGKKDLAPFLTDAAEGLELLVTWNQRTDDAFREHAKNVENTAGSYQEYIDELTRAAGMVGKIVDEEGNLIRIRGDGGFKVVEANFAISKAQWEVRQSGIAVYEQLRENQEQLEKNIDVMGQFRGAALEAKEAEEKFKEEIKELGTLMAGRLGQEMDDYREDHDDLIKRAQDLKKEIAELEREASTAKSRKEAEKLAEKIAETKEEYSETIDEVKELKQAHSEKTKQILFDLIAERVAMLGLPFDEQFQLLDALAHRWGLIDDATFNAMREADRALIEFVQGAGIMQTLDRLDAIDGAIKEIEGVHEIVLRFKQVGDIPTVAFTGAGIARQHGGPVAPGQGYLVGERGPEFFMPNTAGRIVPNNTINNMGGDTFNSITVVGGPGQSPEEIADMVLVKLNRAGRNYGNSGAWAAGG